MEKFLWLLPVLAILGVWYKKYQKAKRDAALYLFKEKGKEINEKLSGVSLLELVNRANKRKKR